jgi:hypothetical protein
MQLYIAEHTQSTLTFVMQILVSLFSYNKFIRVVVVDFQS